MGFALATVKDVINFNNCLFKLIILSEKKYQENFEMCDFSSHKVKNNI